MLDNVSMTSMSTIEALLSDQIADLKIFDSNSINGKHVFLP